MWQERDRRAEAEGTPERPRYVLMEKGRDLLPVLVALMQWGDRWQSGRAPPVILTDQAGRVLPRVRVAGRDGEAVTAETLRFRAGPGADEGTRRFIERARPDAGRAVIKPAAAGKKRAR